MVGGAGPSARALGQPEDQRSGHQDGVWQSPRLSGS